jgi:hypothetical protein
MVNVFLCIFDFFLTIQNYNLFIYIMQEKKLDFNYLIK